ncbi:MAG: glycosyltransferase [Verrucomicrobia bacterium]|nr:glycosyltransferase [Verrucomicrobiota bacterium]
MLERRVTDMVEYSVIIPAHNEEAWLPACLDSIERAAECARIKPEIVVVLNRCEDRTEDLARPRAVLVREEAPNLARIRNAGARASTGRTLITLDADSRMAPNLFIEVGRALESGRYVGGGVPVRAERVSPGIVATGILLLIPFLVRGLSGGLFWCGRPDFEAIGGFDERWLSGEDFDFAVRLKKHGRATARKFATLWRTHILTSCRKFDRWGDWFVWKILLRDPRGFVATYRGRNPALANRFWYAAERFRDSKAGADDQAVRNNSRIRS